MPACNRCQQDDKPCFYAKSRRGMRDRSAPKKNKTSTSRTGSHSPTALNDQFSFMNVNSSNGHMIGNTTNELYIGSSNSSTGSPTRSPSIPTTSRQLVDLFYTYVNCLQKYEANTNNPKDTSTNPTPSSSPGTTSSPA